MIDLSANTDPAGNAPSPRFGVVRRVPLLPLSFAIAFAGLFAASVLSLGHIMHLPVPCGASHGCGAVAAHPSSKVAGLPIAYIGVAAYIGLIALLSRTPGALWARKAFLCFAAAGTLGSAGLLLYSQTAIRATCAWCVASGMAMALLLFVSICIVRARRPLVISISIFWTLAALTALAIGAQAGFMQRAANTPPIPAERIASVKAEDIVDPDKCLGPAAAPITIVMFSDLCCPACKLVHGKLVEFQRANPNGVRFAYRHMPLWKQSGAPAALSEIAAENHKFWEFAAAFHALPGQLDTVMYPELMKKVGLDAAAAQSRIADAYDPAVVRFRRDVDLAEKLGVHATPTFIVIVADNPPFSANQVTLPRFMNSKYVQEKLALAALANKSPMLTPTQPAHAP